MNLSAKILIRKDYIKQDGTAAVILLVTIARQKKRYPLNISWDPNYWDEANQRCKPRHTRDQLSSDYNLVIQAAEARVSEYQINCRLGDVIMTHASFFAYYHKKGTTKSLIAWGIEWARQRQKNNDISFYTYTRYIGSINKLISWKKEIHFADLTDKWAFEFDNWLKKTIQKRGDNTQNTRWHHHKGIKSIIKAAKKEKIVFIDPYESFSISPATGSFTAINESELAKLVEYYATTDNIVHRRVLSRFLFSCMTSLRLSDLVRVNANWLDEHNVMHFTPAKTIRHKKKVHRVPLNDYAIKLFRSAQADDHEGCIFAHYSDQANNRILKVIAEKLLINKKISHHVGRHSFATIMLRNGARLNSVMRYMDHSKIEITMKYDHVELDDLARDVGKINPLPAQPV